MKNRIYELIDFIIDRIYDSNKKEARIDLCNFCTYGATCSEQDDCREGIYKYLVSKEE